MTRRDAKTAIWPGLEAGVPKPLMPYSPAIKAGDWTFIAGTIASDFATGLAPEIKNANPWLENDLAAQSRYVLRNLYSTIKACDLEPARDMVRMWQWFVTDRPSAEDFAAGNNVAGIDIAPYLRSRAAAAAASPPSSYLSVRELLCRGTTVEVDMICIAGGSNQIIDVPVLGKSLDPAPRAVRRGDWIFIGAVGGEPRIENSGSAWFASDVEQQTHGVLQKLDTIAKAAGTTLDRTVKADVYIGHPADFAAVDHVWQQWFPHDPPARVVIPYLGMGAAGRRVEVALTLLAADATITKRTIVAPTAPRPLGHEPQAVKAGAYLFFSTQMAFDDVGRLAAGMVRNPEFPWYGSPGQAQMRYMMKNVAAICEAAGTSVDQICRRVCFHSDFQWFAESIEEWARYFPEDKPASTTLRLGGPLVVAGANTLLDLIAYAP
jgi:enamine deaminase RidA (YjgF/YER057c/UK114 family)